MLYIHKLNDFNPKSAQVESVYLIRELKQRTPFPLREQQVTNYLNEFCISDTDKAMVRDAHALIEPTIETIHLLFQQQEEIHEAINIQRAMQILTALIPTIENNLRYLEEMSAWQETSLVQLVPLFNAIPTLHTNESKVACDQQLNSVFSTILRNNEFMFHHGDIINEGYLSNITGLCEGMAKGYFFHVSLEEELKKITFDQIKDRIPSTKLAEVEIIAGQLETIRQGVARAYEVNMRMVNLALILYSYVRWLASEAR